MAEALQTHTQTRRHTHTHTEPEIFAEITKKNVSCKKPLFLNYLLNRFPSNIDEITIKTNSDPIRFLDRNLVLFATRQVGGTVYSGNVTCVFNFITCNHIRVKVATQSELL